LGANPINPLPLRLYLLPVTKPPYATLIFIINIHLVSLLLEHDDSWRENLVGNKHKCEPMCGVNLKKFLSPTLDRSPRVIVFISRKVTLWFGPQGVPSFVRRRSTHTMSNITRARRRPAGSDRGLGLVIY
jgi:hypothetical protein